MYTEMIKVSPSTTSFLYKHGRVLIHFSSSSIHLHQRSSSSSSRKKERVKMGAIELIPKEYGYVVLVLVLYTFLNFWMALQVGKARKKYKVFYPTLYAIESENKDANLFNCVQRGHQNSLEMMPVFFTLMVLGGLRHPLIAAGLGFVYTVARYFYFTGYSTGVPKNRLKIGGLNFVAVVALQICAISCGISLLMG